jgi:hypothetical protein
MSGTVEVRTVTTAASAAGTAAGQEAGAQHEETGSRIEVAGLTGGEGGGVRVEDLRAPRVIRGETAGMGLGESARCQRQASSLHATESIPAIRLTAGVK